MPYRDPEIRKMYMKSVRHRYREADKERQKKWVIANHEHVKQYQRDRWRRLHSISSGAPGSIRYEAKLMGYKSGFERTFSTNLSSRSIKFQYETLKVPYILKCEYNPDFYFPEHGFYVETKGKLLYEDRRKHLAVKRQHPEIDIRFCFMEAHKKMPGTKSTHAQWAERNGFLWCDKEIPEEWFNDRQ